jgi:hypothetical protein
MEKKSHDERLGVLPRAAAAILVGLGVMGAAACAEPPRPDVPGADQATEVVPLGEARVAVPHLRVELLEVTRASAGVVEVRFALACAADAPGPVPIAPLLATAPGDAGSIADVYLVDEAAQKKYFVVRDGARQPIGSRDLDPIAPGMSRVLWTRLAAPSPGEEVVSVHIPGTPPFTGVPLATGRGDDERPGPAELSRPADRM